jgi:flagellar hook-length control protein FliK
MNAAPPVLQAQPSSGPVQPNASDSAASASPRAGGQDFAAALSDAGGKPARKNVAHKQQDPAATGSSLPVSGNPSPLAQTPPPPAKTDAAAAAGPPAAGPPAAVSAPAPDAAAPVKGSPSAQGSGPAASVPVSAAQADAAAVATSLTPELLDPAVPPTTAAGADAATSADGPGPTGPGSGITMPLAAGMQTPPTPGTSAAPTIPAAPAGNARTVKLSDAAAKQGTGAPANLAPSAADANTQNDSTSSNGPAAAGTDAATQAVMAAAVAQSNAPSPDSSSSDDPAISDTGAVQGAAVLSNAAAGDAVAGNPAAGDAATALAHASEAATAAAATSAAVTAATAASVAQSLSSVASAGAADKRTRGNSPDSTLSGASNDGSVGAAQLLTSNISTDSAPTPTFKVPAGVDTAQFGQGVADRVALMMDGNLTSAKLQVNPPALGPIEVRIALQGGHAQVSFLSHSAVTRDALESSSEKLREMLGSQGFSSVSVDISQRSFQERSPPSQAYESAPSISGDAPVLAQAPLSMARSASGLLDAYA